MKHKTTFTLTGDKEMMATLRRLANRMGDRMLQAMRLEAEQIMTKSKRDFVPVDLGILRASGHVGDVKRRGKNIQVKLSYGGAAVPYALAVHEHPSTHSPPSWQGVPVKFSPRGRGPKYLERPMREAQAGFAQRMASRLDPQEFPG